MNDKHVIIRGARVYEVHAYCQYSHLSWQGIISNISRATPIEQGNISNISPATPIKSRVRLSNLLRVAPTILMEESSFHLGEDSLLFSIT
jgi:hypothetical protein